MKDITGKVNEKEIENAEFFMVPGQFHRAVDAWESLGMTEKVIVASLACATDFLFEMDAYGVAIKYFEKGGRKDIADLVLKICQDAGLTPNTTELYPCNPHCPSHISMSKNIGELIKDSDYQKKYSRSPLVTDVANQAKTLREYILEQNFIENAANSKI